VTTREQIEAAWLALLAALKQKRSKYRGRELGSDKEGRTEKPGRMAPSSRDSVERFLELKAVRDAKRTRVGVRRA